ncbi:class I adenylate-forming enzyme family protein [Thermophilibacter sp.]
MIRGCSCWNRALQRDMVTRSFGGREVTTFRDLPQSLYHALAATAARTPDATAIVDDWGRPTSFSALLAHTDELAAHLAGLGVGRGDHVGLLMHADLEFAVALFAIAKIGAVCVPVPTKYREPEVASLMRAADLGALVTGEEFSAWEASFPVPAERVVWSRGVERGYGFAGLAGAPVEACGAPEDPVIMMFTSGTTSAAKGVVLRNYNVCHAAMTYARLMGTTPDDRCLIPIPIYHVTGLIALLVQFVLVGATTYLHRLFDARRVLACVRDDEITYLHGSPTAFAELLPLREEFCELPSVRVMLSGSSYEPLPAMRAFHDWMPTATFQVVYGMTETASPALLFPLDSPTSVFAGATGKPVPGVDVKIVDESGAEVACGEVGELMVRGACVTEGYYGRVAAGPDAEGWLATGDMARANAEGMVWVVDRKKDMINRGGEKVWCSALEEIVCELPFVSACCVTGIPDELYGEVPVAAVVSAPGFSPTERELQQALAGRIAHFKIPVHVVFVDAIPQTRGEKPDRAAVRALVLDSIKRTEEK